MAYKGLNDFIRVLEKNSELHRINTFVDPVLEITEVTDRITKACGKALLFENTGTTFPLLINAFGSERRIALAMGRRDINGAASDILTLFESLTALKGASLKNLASLPQLLKIPSYLPARTKRKGACQKHVIKDPDLGILPVLK
jgi:4-hydroxy-3-polyprenylbenzoate decarboxylase